MQVSTQFYIYIYKKYYFYFTPLSLSLSRSVLAVSILRSAKRLISASIEMPKSVELLDLSYNDITNIDADCFEVSFLLIFVSIYIL